jgi:hypothetical protein
MSLLLIVALMEIGLTACLNSGREVKDIIENRPGYLNEYFSGKTVPHELLLLFSKERGDFYRYRSFNVTYALKIDKDNENIDVKCQTIYLGLNLDRVDCELIKSNGFVIGSSFEINYLGLIAVRTQIAYYNDKLASLIKKIRHITTFPDGLINAKVGEEYKFSASVGIEHHVYDPVVNIDYTLRAKQAILATQFSPTLKGEAIEIDIETKNVNGMPASKDVRYYLPYYGVSINGSLQSSSTNNIYTVKKIEIQ